MSTFSSDLGSFYAAGRASLLAFCVLTDRDYDPNWHHEELAGTLERVEKGEIRRLIVEMPPRHGKSHLSTICFPAWFLGRNPKKEIVTASYNADLAQDFGAKTRDLVDSEEYRSIFPQITLKEDTQAKSKWKTDQGGSYYSVGIGGSLSGRGAHILLIDDPCKNREDAESETYRKKVWGWYTSTARTRLEKDAAIIVIATRWHLYDLTGQLLELEETAGGEKWHRITYPAIAIQDEKWRKIGAALWPKKYDLASLKATQAAIGAREWLSLFQQSPIASENQEFRQEFFRYFEEAEIKKKNLAHYTFVDLAISQKSSADNTVIRTIGKERDSPNIYLIEETAGKLDPFQTIEAIFEHHKRYHPVKVGVESNGYQESLAYYLEEEQRRRQRYFTIERIKNTTEKEARIRGIVPLYRAGVLFHRLSDKELEGELLQFPFGKHDDRIDALVGAIELLSEFGVSDGKIFGLGKGRVMIPTPVVQKDGTIRSRAPTQLVYAEKQGFDWRSL